MQNEFKIAKNRYRVLAHIIDFLLFFIIAFSFAYFYGTPSDNGYSLSGLPAFLVMIIGLALWPISEGLWGQTIGKRILKIKVVSEKGDPVDMRQAIKRFLMGAIDQCLAIGLLVAHLSEKN